MSQKEDPSKDQGTPKAGQLSSLQTPPPTPSPIKAASAALSPGAESSSRGPSCLELPKEEPTARVKAKSAHQRPLSIDLSDGVNRDEEFQRLFEFPPSEKLVEDFSCAFQRKVLRQGRMYITQKHIAFHSVLDCKFALDFGDVTSIEKRKTLQLFNNAIEVATTGGTYFFTSFVFRDQAYEVLQDLLQLYRQRRNSKSGRARSSENSPAKTVAPAEPLPSPDPDPKRSAVAEEQRDSCAEDNSDEDEDEDEEEEDESDAEPETSALLGGSERLSETPKLTAKPPLGSPNMVPLSAPGSSRDGGSRQPSARTPAVGTPLKGSPPIETIDAPPAPSPLDLSEPQAGRRSPHRRAESWPVAPGVPQPPLSPKGGGSPRLHCSADLTGKLPPVPSA
eukprot:RCo043131